MRIQRKNYALNFKADGRILSMENLLTGENCAVSDSGEYFVLNGKKIDSGACVSMQAGEDCVTFAYAGGIETRWDFRDDFCEKTVRITLPASGILDQVGVLKLEFPDAQEVHYHDDCTIWHCPMSYYVRYPLGGMFFGLEYPYWDGEGAGELAFSPWVQLQAGEKFTAEKAFLGVYRRENRAVLSHGPYPGARRQRYWDMYDRDRCGLGQHFAGGKVPDDVGIPEEEQDLGEIHAMQDFFRAYLQEMPLPEKGYYVWQNGWWAKLFNADPACIGVLKKAGIHDVMTAAMYYGHDSHPCTEPKYIRDARLEPLGFPADPEAGGNAATMENGFHHEVKVEEGTRDAVTAYSDEFSAPPDYEELIRRGDEEGVHIDSFSTPNNAYANAPQWVALQENGEPHRYFGTKVSCPACREYMDFHFKVLSRMMDRCKPNIWCFDGRWMGFHEICCTGDTVGEAPCYAENHGHLPGKSRYMEWKNIEEFRRKLRERYPDTCFENYYGMKRGSTWSLRYFNSDENYYECAGPDDNRFQTWHNEMDRFRPTYMHYAPIMGNNAADFEYSMISNISTSSYAQCAFGYHGLKDDPACTDVFKKWKKWADENWRYLKRRENLFGCPGDVAIDGSAHVVDGEGWVFLFCTTDTPASASLCLAEIPGLDQSARYELRAIHPEERLLGSIPAAGSMRVHMAPHTAMVIRLRKQDA